MKKLTNERLPWWTEGKNTLSLYLAEFRTCRRTIDRVLGLVICVEHERVRRTVTQHCFSTSNELLALLVINTFYMDASNSVFVGILCVGLQTSTRAQPDICRHK